MEIRSPGEAPTRRASADWFTGTVWQDAVIDARDELLPLIQSFGIKHL